MAVEYKLSVVVIVEMTMDNNHYHHTHCLQRFCVRIPGLSCYVWLALTVCLFRILFRLPRFSPGKLCSNTFLSLAFGDLPA